MKERPLPKPAEANRFARTRPQDHAKRREWHACQNHVKSTPTGPPSAGPAGLDLTEPARRAAEHS